MPDGKRVEEGESADAHTLDCESAGCRPQLCHSRSGAAGGVHASDVMHREDSAGEEKVVITWWRLKGRFRGPQGSRVDGGDMAETLERVKRHLALRRRSMRRASLSQARVRVRVFESGEVHGCVYIRRITVGGRWVRRGER